MNPLAVASDASTNEYWDIDGVPLNTWSYAIKSQGGSRLQPPPLRGSNITIPYRPGDVWVPKQPGARTISLSMWVVGAAPNGIIYDRNRFLYNWRQLANLFWRPNEEFVLTKRFRGVDKEGTLVTAVGRGQYVQGLEASMTTPQRADFTVDIVMADPFFYGDEQTVNFGPLPSTALTQTFTVPGDWDTNQIKFEVEGPATSPMWLYSTPSPATWARFDAVVADGDSLDVNVNTFSAVATVSAVQHKAVGYMKHSGGAFWMTLRPGTATVQFGAASGTGSSALKFRPVYW